MPIFISYFKTPYGEMVLGEYDNQLCIADWRYRSMRNVLDTKIKIYLGCEFIEKETDLHIEVKIQFQNYFEKKCQDFQLPLLPIGTDFQKSVWEALRAIPFGKTYSYLELAKALGNTNAVRAVASANGANTLAIIIPCHRIIGSNGDLVGYAGGLNVKKKLLELEGSSLIQPTLF